MYIVTNKQCGCQAGTDKFGNVVFKYCPKHKAADDLYEALSYLVGDLSGFIANQKDYLEEARKALSKADGEKPSSLKGA